ncbi:MAG: hypothetical protein KJO82_11195 [Gammaproteobacteria bacterium]|nr:hypothetical protein [Gammaproteobacteria bacterium]
MKCFKRIQVLCAVLSAGLLIGCGGGGSSGSSASPPPPPPPSGGIGRNGIAVGPVSNFGSIVVNGVRYDTANATFTINDVTGSEDDLSVGQVVVVQGTIDDNGTTGTAAQVIFDDLVKGPVASINVPGSSLEVLGQTVLVGPDTSFDDGFSPASLEGVSVNQIVEVSGQFDANGFIVATRIEPKPAGTQFEVHGTVAALDAANFAFSLGNLAVDYSNAILDNFPGGQVSNGDFVEAKGMSLGAGGELLATRVELEGFLPGANDGDRIEIEGFITRFMSAQDFDVAGVPVTTTASTVYEGGDASDLGLNVKVEVEGDIDANGTVVATKIEIRRAKAVRVTANADSVNAANDSLVILGIPVTVDTLTRFEDKSNADVDPLTLADINAGDYLEIRGDELPAGSGTILATILEREDPEAEAILQGFVETIADPSFTILGVTINTDGATVFRDVNDNVITAADFFNRVTASSLVKAKGNEIADSAITATEVEFELEF